MNDTQVADRAWITMRVHLLHSHLCHYQFLSRFLQFYHRLFGASPLMASVSATCPRFQSLFSQSDKTSRAAGLKLVSVGRAKCTGFPPLKASRFRVSCSAKPETVEKVIEIVRKQLAIKPETVLTTETEFVELGADSLDTVEIVMTLEEEFDINVEEESSQNITTVQEVADMIEKLVQKKAEGES